MSNPERIFCNAKIRSGFDTVAKILLLESEIAASDLVITGEGRLDKQTLDGKGPLGVSVLARRHCKPILAFAGSIAPGLNTRPYFDQAFAITPPSMALDEALKTASPLLERSVASVATRFRPVK